MLARLVVGVLVCYAAMTWAGVCLAQDAPAGAIDWEILTQMDDVDRKLVEAYRETAQDLEFLALEMARRFPSPLLELEVRRDLSRIRWKARSEYRDAVWTEALVCPEDRKHLRALEGVLSLGSARGAWLPMRIDGDRLIAPPEWNDRAILLRPGGEMVRLMRLTP